MAHSANWLFISTKSLIKSSFKLFLVLATQRSVSDRCLSPEKPIQSRHHFSIYSVWTKAYSRCQHQRCSMLNFNFVDTNNHNHLHWNTHPESKLKTLHWIRVVGRHNFHFNSISIVCWNYMKQKTRCENRNSNSNNDIGMDCCCFIVQVHCQKLIRWRKVFWNFFFVILFNMGLYFCYFFHHFTLNPY